MLDKEAEISKALKRARIWGPIFGFVAPVFLLVIAYLLIDGRATAGRDLSKLMILFYLLCALSVINLMIAVYIYRKIPTFLFRHFLKPPYWSSGVMGQLPEFRLKSQFVTLAQTIPIIIIIIIESCSAYGFVLFLSGFDYQVLLAFVAFTVIGYMIVRPRREFFERLYEKIEKHKTEIMA